MYFVYGDAEIDHLKKRDKRLGEAIERIGPIQREVETDLFASVIHHIVGQQVSMAAQATVWRRLNALLGTVTPESVCACGEAELQALGMTFRKAGYILDFARRVHSGAFDVAALADMDDEAVCAALSSLRGVGPWTAEMLMTFCLQRPDIVSYGDLAILRGMRMLYRRRRIDRADFARYRQRYSPYGTAASLYLWAIAGGALPELTDPGAKAMKK